MSEFFDETFEEQESREKLEYFFGQYSAEIRKNLLSKNIKKPDNLYDILYTKVRRDLLAKNEQTFNVSVEDIAKDVRNNMLSKHVEHQINLDNSGENYRQNQLSKNKLLTSSVNLSKMADAIRENLLASNVPSDINLENYSQTIREKNLSSNVENDVNLDQRADEVRSNLLSKNKSDSNVDLDSIADIARQNLLSSNIEVSQNIDKTSEHYRNLSLGKNKENEFDIDKQSSQYREVQDSKNVDSQINLDDLANSVRGNLISKNKDIENDIDKIAETARRKNESSNVENSKDINKIAEISRNNMVSSNVDKPIDLDKTAKSERNNQESKNNDKVTNLDSPSEKIRNIMLSSNKEGKVDLDKLSEQIREAMLSSNKTDNTSVETIGEVARQNLLSSNKENGINLDKSSGPVRDNLLSANKPVDINLDNDSRLPRANLLASNAPKDINLDQDSQAPRASLLASNVPVNIDLDDNAQIPRNSLLASNVPNNTDLDQSAQAPRNSLLASNVPNNIDLDESSQTPRNNLLASNVPNNINLDSLSSVPRGTLLAANVPNPTNLDASASIERREELASNVKIPINLDYDGSVARSKLLAANSNHINANLDENAADIRHKLLSSNVHSTNHIDDIANIFRHDLLSKNAKSTGLGTNVFLAGTSLFIGVSNLEIISTPIRELMKLRGKMFTKNSKLQPDYGLQTNVIGEASATITSAAQLYNLQKNAFMGVRYFDKQSGYLTLLNHNTGGFQEMLASGNKLSSFRQTETNTTPASVISQNSGVYVGLPTNVDNTSPVTGLLKPGNENAKLGTAASMMSNTVPTDSIATDFSLNSRGVQRIINIIRNDNSIPLAKNYDSQNTTSFIIGTDKDGTPKRANTRYTIANPYQPNKDAGTLEFRIKNYAIAKGDNTLVNTMSFPPYIKSFANSDSANWNKIDYLGRPEPVYTYSNSNREGSISFYVLTDYSQEVDIGYDYEKQSKITETFDKHFSQTAGNKKDRINQIDVEIKSKEKEIQKYTEKIAASDGNDVSGLAVFQQKIAELKLEISNLEIKKLEISNSTDSGSNRDYKEFDILEGNIYKKLIDNGKPKDVNGNIDLKTEETAQRLARMKKKLLFQPAFFSGDKKDFLTRMEFIAKLTRPSRNASGKGFSFTYPPVAHLHLGDWFNHDIIINNVSYDYSDAPWTIDGQDGRTQPMWAVVTISFNIVGTYGAKENEDVPLSTDLGGFFQTRAGK
jgi:hypothetical protein